MLDMIIKILPYIGIVVGLSGLFICLSILRDMHNFWIVKWKGHK